MMFAFPHPQTAFIRITPKQRKRIEVLIQDLVMLLDFIDGEDDLEDGADAEPWLGWTQSGSKANFSDDREMEDDNEDDDPAEDSDNGLGDREGMQEQVGDLL